MILEDIVISGVSGRFPNCNNIAELKENLLNGIDMVTESKTRSHSGYHKIPRRKGTLNDLSKFDANFFGVLPNQATSMDPQLRIFLEVTYEAIIDAGVNIAELKGSKTAVFVALSATDAKEYFTTHDDTNTFGLAGSAGAMIANRISFAYDLKGPSMVLDTGCSSGIVALHQAILAMKDEKCDSAIVGGLNLLLNPAVTVQFMKYSMINPEGMCKAFDASGNGFARSEAVAAVFLQKMGKARRIYAKILGVHINIDGYKEHGITYPSTIMQKELLLDTFGENGLDPSRVAYVEAHGTGTAVGDPIEVNAIADFFCKNRSTPLLIGSLKSNIGHTEAASGICSIVKVLIGMESGILPANLHFKTPNKNIPSLVDGRLQVVTENRSWPDGIALINSFGLGGVNAHVILEPNPQKKKNNYQEFSSTRVVCASGTTTEAVSSIFDAVQNHKDDVEFLALIDSIYKTNIEGHDFRGYTVIGDKYAQDICEVSHTKKPIWFIYSGMGSQWAQMAKDLMKIPAFSTSIKKSAKCLKPYGIELENLLLNAPETVFDNILNSFVAITSIQIALTDLLKMIDICPDGIIGHSFAEICSGYADGSLTAEQCILAAYFRGKAVLESNLIEGRMAAIGCSWEEAKKRCPPGITVACNNSPNNVTVSGPKEAITDFVAQLTAENIFATIVNTGTCASHSEYVTKSATKFCDYLKTIIPKPKPRSSAWISTSIPEAEWNSELAKMNSPEYHMNNLISPVYFYDVLKIVPKDAIVIEIAPHGHFQTFLKQSLGKLTTTINLMIRKSDDNLKTLLSAFGRIYAAGGQPNLRNLYDVVSFPVGRGTTSISPFIKWNHSVDFFVPDFSSNKSGNKESQFQVDLSKDELKYLEGHSLNGAILFPAAGYLTIVWKTFAKMLDVDFEQLAVGFRNVKFLRATFLTKKDPVTFNINILVSTGEFEVSENGMVAFSGQIFALENPSNNTNPRSLSDAFSLCTEDIYTELSLRGYNFTGSFRSILGSDLDGFHGKLKWEGNWITFIDSVLQFYLIHLTRPLILPTQIKNIIIDPKKHKDFEVFYESNLDVLRSGGIEIRGLRTVSVGRKQQETFFLHLEQYKFVPFISNEPLSSDDTEAEEMAIIVLSQIVLENCSSTTITLAEFVSTLSNKDPLVILFKRIFEKQPIAIVDATLVLPEGIECPDLAKNDIQLMSANTVMANFVENLDLVLLDMYDTDKPMILEKDLRNGVFVLIRSKSIISNENKDFTVISSQMTSSSRYTLLRKLENIAINGPCIDITSEDFNWIEKIKNVLKENDVPKKIYIYSTDKNQSGIVGMTNCLRLESGVDVRAIFILNPQVSNFSLEQYSDQLKKDLVQNVLKNEEWGSFRHLPIKDEKENIKVSHAFINNEVKGDLSSFKWIASPLCYKKSYKTICQVCFAALNFRDIMLALNKLPLEIIPDSEGKENSLLGLEFSGWNSNKQRVMGIVPFNGLASTVLTHNDLVWLVPDKWSLEDAVTIPVAYATCYYALIMRGKMQRGESILIHSGAGGVGLAAITICLSMGCKVFTTVGTEEKKKFLLKHFPQLNYIGNSRDTSFEKLVMNNTNGAGVDLVLNSLDGDKFQASIRCLAANGRFLEIEKMELVRNSLLGLDVFLKNITFHGIFLERMFEKHVPEKDELWQLVQDGIENDVIKPLNRQVFDKSQTEGAFRFMSSGKHMGKILVKIREEESSSEEFLVDAIANTYFDPNKSYIIIGGLGGFGLELTNWLITRGATKVILNARNTPKTGYQLYCLRKWQKAGINVMVSTTDAATTAGATDLINQANALAPVGGIFNLAAILSDASMKDQTEEHFRVVCKPKINITKEMDLASRKLTPHLDYFVVFSSMSSGRGNPGQTNYGFANSAVDRIIEARHSLGLHGLAIQFGPIANVGWLQRTLGADARFRGIIPQRVDSCLDAIDKFLHKPYPVVASLILVENKNLRGSKKNDSIAESVAHILCIKDVSTINKNATLAALGADSLLIGEIRQVLERKYNIVLGVDQVRNLNFEMLAQYNCKTNK